MSPLRSTRMGSLPPCKDLCCSSASLFTTWPFFRFVCILATSLTAGIFVYGRYLLSQQVSVFALTVGSFVLARSKVRPRTGTKNIRAYCLLAEVRRHYSGRRLPCYFGFTWGLVEFRKMLWRLPPIHFGKEDGVKRTLLRVACQSETFLASPWQGGAILHASVAHWLPK